MARLNEPFSESPYADLSAGHIHALVRVRQIRALIQGEPQHELSPYLVVNLATCFEWSARAIVKIMIDYAPDQINADAKILRDLKLSYSTILSAHNSQFSIGDLVAINRNFSSFEDVQDSLFDLLGKQDAAFLTKLKLFLMKIPLKSKSIGEILNNMFRARHELVHGSPRHPMFADERAPFVAKRDLLLYCTVIEFYVQQFEKFMRSTVPNYSDRSTLDMRISQNKRLVKTDTRITELEKAIEKTLDANTAREFRAAQRAWKLWRMRETEFQTHMWRGGTFRNVARLGESTSIGTHRIRSLEFFLRNNT